MSGPARTDRHSDRLQDFNKTSVTSGEVNRGNPKSPSNPVGHSLWFPIGHQADTEGGRWLHLGKNWACWAALKPSQKKVSRGVLLFNAIQLNLFIRVVWPNNVPLRCFFHLSYGVLFLLLSPIFAFLSFSLLLLLLLLLTLPICWFQFLIHLFPIFPSHEYLHVLDCNKHRSGVLSKAVPASPQDELPVVVTGITSILSCRKVAPSEPRNYSN